MADRITGIIESNSEIAKSLTQFSKEILSTYRTYAWELFSLQRRVVNEAFRPRRRPEDVAMGSPGRAQDHALIGRLFREVLAEDDFDRIGEFATPAAAEHLRRTWGSIRGLMPGCQIMVDDIYTSESGQLAVQLRIDGTHTGRIDNFDLEPTKRHVNVTAVELVKVRNGKLVESTSVIDCGQLARQLDVEARPLAAALSM